MRNIKFRGKNEFNKWVYGTGIVPVEYNCRDTKKYEILQKVNYDELECFNPIYETEEVTTKTIGQYTDVKDKNGVEIYEGDIVHFKGNYQDKKNYVVFYDNMKAGFFITPTHCYDWRLEHQDYIRANFINAKNKEVIGNIYDNQELLERTSNI